MRIIASTQLDTGSQRESYKQEVVCYNLGKSPDLSNSIWADPQGIAFSVILAV